MSALQTAPQSMPPMLLVTVPDPVPDFETVSVKRDGAVLGTFTVTDSTICGAAL